MKIEFQYFEGCPNSQKTLQNLKGIIQELEINETNLLVIEVPDFEKAKEVNFQGSPTILINGKDVYTGKEPEGFSYTCRVYTFGNQRTGVLSKEFIKSKMKINN